MSFHRWYTDAETPGFVNVFDTGHLTLKVQYT